MAAGAIIVETHPHQTTHLIHHHSLWRQAGISSTTYYISQSYDSILPRLQHCNDRTIALLEELSDLDNRQELDQTDYDELEQELKAHFRNSWQTIMTRQITPTRQILGKLFNGHRIPLTPVQGTEGIYFEFKGMASIGRLLTGRAKEVVSPTGLSGICQNVLGDWGLPFKGSVKAA